MQTLYGCTCTNADGSIIPAKKYSISHPRGGQRWVENSSEFAEQTSTSRRHDAASDEGRDRWTFNIITVDGMAHIRLEYLHFTTLNLAEKSELLPIEPVLSKFVNSSAKTTRCLYCGTLSNPSFSTLCSPPSTNRRQVLSVVPPRASGTNAKTHYLGVSTSPQT